MEEIYFDEVKRAQRGTWKNFVILSLLLSSFVALAIGVLTFSYFTYSSLSPLQKFYFSQYAKSYLNQSNFTRHGKYKILMYQAVDRKTKKKDWYACLEEQLIARTDERGNVMFDQNKNPMFMIRNEVPYEKNSYMFYPDKIEHKWAHDFLSQRIYKTDFPEFFYPGAGGAAFSFVFAFAGMCAFRKKRLSKILEGKYLRGTRLLSPEQYLGEMKTEADGIGINVLTMK
jgi:hypothetical protein